MKAIAWDACRDGKQNGDVSITEKEFSDRKQAALWLISMKNEWEPKAEVSDFIMLKHLLKYNFLRIEINPPHCYEFAIL